MACRSLLEALQDVPDPRSRRGRRYPLSPILALVVLGILLGRRSLTAIATLPRDYGDAFPLLLGFPRKHIPCLSNLSTLLRRLPVDAFEAVLSAWIADHLPRFADSTPLLDPPDAAAAVPPDAAAPLVVHLDGKTLRGSGSKTPPADGAAPLPGVHLLSVFQSKAGAVLAQVRVDAKTNEHKAALELLGVLPAASTQKQTPTPPEPDAAGETPQRYVITADAMFCQKEIAQAIQDRGDDYLIFAKDNQPGLVGAIEAGLTFVATAATFSPGSDGRGWPGATLGDGSTGRDPTEQPLRADL